MWISSPIRLVVGDYFPFKGKTIYVMKCYYSVASDSWKASVIVL